MDEVFHNPDAVVASVFMYKGCDSVDPMIHCGPMWDYDRAMGSYGSNAYYVDNARQVGRYGIYVEQLMNFEEVASLVYEKFENEMLPYVDNKVRADIFDLDQMIRASAEMVATYESRWIEMDLVLQNALAFADIDLSQADPAVFEDFAEMIRQKQEEAQEGSQETGM